MFFQLIFNISQISEDMTMATPVKKSTDTIPPKKVYNLIYFKIFKLTLRPLSYYEPYCYLFCRCPNEK